MIKFISPLLFGIILTACGAIPTFTPTLTRVPTQAPTNTPTIAPTNTAVPPTFTPSVTFTPAPPTATAIPPVAIMRIRVNVRQGPGAAYPKVGELDRNVKVVIVGRSEDGKWYQVPYATGKTGWVAVDFVDVSGAVEKVPVVAVQAPPATLTPTATRVFTGTATPQPTATQALLPPTGRIYFIVSQNNLYLAAWFSPDKKDAPAPEARLGSPNALPADLKPNLATNAAPFDWSRAVGKLAFVYNSGQDKLEVEDQNGMSAPLDSHGGISSPRWSPDGTQIAYIGMDGNEFKSQFIYTIGAEGGNHQILLAARTNPNGAGEQFRGLA